MESLQMHQQLVPGLPRLGRRCSVPRRIRLVNPLRAGCREIQAKPKIPFAADGANKKPLKRSRMSKLMPIRLHPALLATAPIPPW